MTVTARHESLAQPRSTGLTVFIIKVGPEGRNKITPTSKSCKTWSGRTDYDQTCADLYRRGHTKGEGYIPISGRSSVVSSSVVEPSALLL